jgi:4-amino-4-deoxy-L-arabinose transferase-like glycosyltransferase
VWRLPSFFEPPWVNDEGTYFAVAQAMAHGYRLYRDVWENKPPGLYLLYSAVYHLVGASLLAIRLITTAAALFAVVLTFFLARQFAGSRAAPPAALLAGLLLGVPFLEGTTGNAEIFVSLFAALGVYCALIREQPVVAGLALFCAVLFKSVGVFDACALGLWLLFRGRRMFWPYAGTFALGIAVVLALAWVSGILSPMISDGVVYAAGYVGFANGGGIPWVLLFKAAALGALTLALRRAPFPFLWLAYAAAGATVGGRFFGHYALQGVVPLSVSTALLLKDRDRLSSRLLVWLPCSFVVLALSSAAAGATLEATGHSSILSRRLQWYTNFVRWATGSEPYATYRDQIDDHVGRNQRIAQALVDLPAGRLLVWGNDPWIYVLSRRLPATPYTSALRQPEVPGETAALRRAVLSATPALVVVFRPPEPPLGAAAAGLAHYYRPRQSSDGATVYVAARSAGRDGLSTITTASARSGTR